MRTRPNWCGQEIDARSAFGQGKAICCKPTEQMGNHMSFEAPCQRAGTLVERFSKCLRKLVGSVENVDQVDLVRGAVVNLIGQEWTVLPRGIVEA